MNVLVVDDHAINRDVLCFMLEDAGYETTEAASGQEAIDLFLADDSIELILMDENMPGMSGAETTQQISALKQDRALSVIFVTAFEDPNVLARCLDAGGDDFVSKPVEKSVLLPKIKAHSRNLENYKSLVQANADLLLHKQATKRELKIVDNIFKNSVNVSDIVCDNIVSYTSAMSLFNGDLVLTAPSPAGGQYILVGDFTGHGLAAAVGSLPVISIFKSFLKRQKSISELATEINTQLFKIMPVGMFFCATLVHMEANGTRFTVWSGGMNDLAVIDSSNLSYQLYPGQHMPLGILNQVEFDNSSQVIQVEKGSKIYIYTDGVNEAKGENDTLFGDQQVINILLQHKQNAIDTLVQEVHNFSPETSQDDDITIVEIQCSPCVHKDKNTLAQVDVCANYHNVASFPWSMSLTIEGADLKTSDPVNQVISFLSSFEGGDLHEDRLFTILSELYNNSLEHGILKLNSKMKDTPDGFDQYYKLRATRIQEVETGCITISLSYFKGLPNRIKIEISDNGDGFDYMSISKAIKNDDVGHGRGLGLLEALCSQLTYSNQGKTVTAWYDFIN